MRFVRHSSSLCKMAVLSAALALPGCGGEDGGEKKDVEVSLPDPGPLGWQWTTGRFEVPQGEEIQDCYFFEVPFDEPVFVNRVTLAMNEGSHHMNVFRLRTIAGLDGAPGEIVHGTDAGGECWKSTNWKDWPLVMNNQSGHQTEDWAMPEGVALQFQPREKLMLQTHYVNATTQKTPARAKVVANFYGVEKTSVQNELGTLFATNQNIQVCPGETGKTFESTCKIAQDGPVTVAAANGHFHSRGDRFTMSQWDEVSGKGADFYESTDWDRPPFDKNIGLELPQNGGVTWTCEFSAKADECGDPNNDCCFTFGGKVEFQEHCNAFVYYYPKGTSDKNCF